MRNAAFLALATCLTIPAIAPVWAAAPAATIFKLTPEGTGEQAGTITVTESPGGAVFAVTVHGLPPGPHGFHVHDKGDCGPATVNGAVVPGGAAGGHWDAGHAGSHQGPAGQGHIGDLPVLEVGQDGNAARGLTAPHIKDLEALRGHAVIIHAGGDNFSDQPAPLGGGGARIACGVLK